MGIITIDHKWAKVSGRSNIFVQSPTYPMDQSMTIPQLSGPNNHCFFITPREVLSTTQLNDGGVFLLFDLPADVLPTYKGLACSITYSIVITVQTPGEANKMTKYAFTVVGNGSSIMPYEIRCSSMAIFGAGAVPAEDALLAMTMDEDDQTGGNTESNADQPNSQSSAFLGQLFNVRDRDKYVCSLSMMSQAEYIYPGCDLSVNISFEGSIQPCFAVRAHVQLCENRSDGSRVQDKVIVESSRSTLSAETVHLKLHLPESMSTSFASPVVKVCYQIVVEFFLDTRTAKSSSSSTSSSAVESTPSRASILVDEDDHGEPFTWVIPVDVMPVPYTRTLTREVNACWDPAVEVLQAVS
jgi:hypothetical protein